MKRVNPVFLSIENESQPLSLHCWLVNQNVSLKKPQETRTCLGFNELKSAHGTCYNRFLVFLILLRKWHKYACQSSRPSTVAHACSFIYNDDILEVVKEYNYLGVIFLVLSLFVTKKNLCTHNLKRLCVMHLVKQKTQVEHGATKLYYCINPQTKQT